MEKTLKAAWDDKCSRTKPDQVLDCVTQPVSAAGALKGKKATVKGAFSRRNQIPKSAFEYIPRTWKPGLKRVPRT